MEPVSASIDRSMSPPPRKTRGAYGKTAKRAALWDFSAKVSAQTVMFVISIFLARLLAPSDFGVTAASRFFITLASRLTQLGLNASLVRMKELRDEHASSVFVLNLVVGLLAFLTLWTASPVLGRFFNSPDVATVLPVSATVFLIVPFGTVASAMLNRHLRYRVSTSIQWCDAVFSGLMTLALAWLGFGYWSLVYGALAGTVMSTIAKVLFSPWKPTFRFSMAALRETISFGLGFQAKRLLVFSTANLDNVVVGRSLGVVSLGFYDKAYGLMNQMTSRMAFDDALMRIFAIIREEPARFRRALMKGVQATSVVTFPILMFSAVTADRLVPVLFGSRWEPAVGPFQVLAAVGMLRAANRPVSAANDSLGLVWVQTAMQAVSVSLLVIGIAVGSRWGLTAASLGVLFAEIVNDSMSMGLLTRYTALRPVDLWRSFWPSLATAGLLGLAVTAVDLALRQLSVTRDGLLLAGDIATAIMVYPVLILWTPFESIETVVRETVDDLAPWLRRYVSVGVLRSRAETPDQLASVTTDS